MQKKSDLKIFGLIWSFIFGAIAIYPLFSGGEIVYWSLYVSAVFLSSAIVYPQIYKIVYFYQSWIALGDVMGKVNSKIIIFVLFYLLFFPIGMILKIFRKDLLGKKLDPKAKSYFIDRREQPKEMENQF